MAETTVHVAIKKSIVARSQNSFLVMVWLFLLAFLRFPVYLVTG